MALPLSVANKRWFRRLVASHEKSLMREYGLSDIVGHLVVCGTFEQFGHCYAFFDSYIEYYQYVPNFQENRRCFYEVIFGEYRQKPHFDVDIELDSPDIDEIAQQTIESLIDGIVMALQQKGVHIDLATNLLLFTSHGGGKRSFHVVVDGYTHSGNKEAEAFYHAVLDHIPEPLRRFVDPKVYNARQQFRIVGCRKLGKDRVKAFNCEWMHHGVVYQHPDVEELDLLAKSLVTFVSDCVDLPCWLEAVTYGLRYRSYDEENDISEETAQRALRLLDTVLGVNAFDIADIKGALIVLKRKAASICPLCQRVHEHENPYLRVNGGCVYWHCRRAPDEARLFVGYLGITSVADILKGKGPSSHGVGSVQEGEEEEEEQFCFGDYGKEPVLSTNVIEQVQALHKPKPEAAPLSLRSLFSR